MLPARFITSDSPNKDLRIELSNILGLSGQKHFELTKRRNFECITLSLTNNQESRNKLNFSSAIMYFCIRRKDLVWVGSYCLSKLHRLSESYSMLLSRHLTYCGWLLWLLELWDKVKIAHPKDRDSIAGIS